jgi:hypothetical protein
VVPETRANRPVVPPAAPEVICGGLDAATADALEIASTPATHRRAAG